MYAEACLFWSLDKFCEIIVRDTRLIQFMSALSGEHLEHLPTPIKSIQRVNPVES